MKFFQGLKHKFNDWFNKKAEDHAEVDSLLGQYRALRNYRNPGDMNVRPTKRYAGWRETKAVRIAHERNYRRNVKARNAALQKEVHFHTFQRHDILVHLLGARLAWRLAPYLNGSYTIRTGAPLLEWKDCPMTPETAEDWLRENVVAIRRAS